MFPPFCSTSWGRFDRTTFARNGGHLHFQGTLMHLPASARAGGGPFRLGGPCAGRAGPHRSSKSFRPTGHIPACRRTGEMPPTDVVSKCASRFPRKPRDAALQREIHRDQFRRRAVECQAPETSGMSAARNCLWEGWRRRRPAACTPGR